MAIERGNEPEELKKYLAVLMRELHEAYPEGLIVTETWNHTRWDRIIEHLYKGLGYSDNVSFLKAYDFEVFGDLNTKPQADTPVAPAPVAPAPIRSAESAPVERTQKKSLVCPKCGSDDISIDTFQENLGSTTVGSQKFKFKQKGHGLFWWLFIGWWWWMIDLCIWICFFPFRLLVQIFKKKKYVGKATSVSQTVNQVVYKKMYICHSCGNTWMKSAGQGSTMSAATKSVNKVQKRF